VLERIRRAVCESPVEDGGHSISVALSAGGACGRGAAAEALIRAADQALYRAKRNGRNQTAMAETALPRLRVV
jgi:GGDEF domain-containing protein